MQGGGGGEGVSLYECKNYDNKSTTGIFPPHQCQKWGPYAATNNQSIGKEGRSIEIIGNYLAVIFEKTYATGRCEVFTQSNPDVSSNYIGVCGSTSNMGCFGAITVLPIKK